MPFIEVYIDAPLAVVEARDPKGLYKKARAGEIKGSHFFGSFVGSIPTDTLDFTGISAPYEAPETPEIHIRTDKLGVEESVKEIVEYLQAQKFI